MNTELLNKLAKIASTKTLEEWAEEDEDTTVYDLTGGHVDDAYNIGHDDGAAYVARMILNEIYPDWKEDL